jgi:integrase/recombinase XerD
MKQIDLAHLLTAFLKEYLPSQRNMSPNTIMAYRDAFTLLLRYCRDVRGIAPDRVNFEHLSAALVVDFLKYLENERRSMPCTRNHRLAALHSFFRYVQVERPDLMLECQRILAIPHKRHERAEVGYLRTEELAAILAQPDLTTRQGRRDAVLLSVLYDTGARITELLRLVAQDIRLEAPAQVRLTGKGGKVRSVPLMKATVLLLTEYFRENGLDRPEQITESLFQNRQGKRLTRSGARHILDKYVSQARKTHPMLREAISPHTFRHTKAMHLLQAGNPLVVIRNILGHSQVQTTEIYARADMEMKRKALETIADISPSPTIPSWQQSPNLLERLRNL